MTKIINQGESEHNIQVAILDYLQKRQVFHYRQNSGAVKTEGRFFRFGALGSPDIVCVIEGRYVGIEVKQPRTFQSGHQKEFQGKLTQAGGIYFLVRSIDEAIEAIEDCMSRLKRNAMV